MTNKFKSTAGATHSQKIVSIQSLNFQPPRHFTKINRRFFHLTGKTSKKMILGTLSLRPFLCPRGMGIGKQGLFLIEVIELVKPLGWFTGSLFFFFFFKALSLGMTIISVISQLTNIFWNGLTPATSSEFL